MRQTQTFRTFSLFHKIVACVLSATIPPATLPEAALALPHGGVVSKGSATLGYSTGKLLISQSTTSATFNWGSFNVKSGQSVAYKTPGSSSVSMNYIGGTTPSTINGTVTSNGILYFMNPNGLIFGSGATVSAAGVMAFGSATPWGTPTGAITNAGTISAATGGTVALVGSSVANSGTISAPGGEVLLAAGSTVTPISGSGSSSLSVATTGGGLVDDSGIVSAETVNGKTGTILLQSGMGSGTTTLESTAVLDASAPNGGNGGAITVNGYKVVLDQIAPLNVSAPAGHPGTIVVDPTTLDIGSASALETVDGTASYLTAPICLTANISLTQSNGLPYPWIPLGTSSSAFTGSFNGNGYTVSGYTITASANDAGFIGYLGSGGIVKNLGVSGTVNGGSYSAIGGIVGYNASGTVETSYNTGSITGSAYVGGVVGQNTGMVEYSYNTGVLSGTAPQVGGVVGQNSGTVEYSYNTGNVTGGNYVGGIVGFNNTTTGTVEYSYNTGSVSGTNYVGGGVGYNNTGLVEYSYNTGSVTGGSDGGGIVGLNTGGTYTDNYWNTSATISSGNTTGVGNSSSPVGGVSGLTSSQFGNPSNFSNWSFNIWNSTAFYSPATSDPWFEGSVVSGSGTMTAPMLVPDFATAIVTGNSGTSVYNGSTVSPGYTATYTMGGSTVTSTNIAVNVGPNAGTYTESATLSAPTAQTSVDSVSTVSGIWTIKKANLTLSGSEVYNGTTTLAGSALTATGVDGQTFSVGGTGSGDLSSPNVQTNAPLANVTNLTLGSSTNGGSDSNYNGLSQTGSSVTITPAPLTATAYYASMTYRGTLPTLSGTVAGFVNGQTLSLDGGSWTTSATSSSNVGSYGVSLTLGSLYSGDYTITNASGNSTALTITAATSTTGGGASGSSSAGRITATQFNPVLQTVDLFQKLPSLPGSPSAGQSSNNASTSPSSSGTSTTLLITPDSSLSVIHSPGDDTSGDGILSAQELKP
jgi:filamentous hemagglutinin family protein